VNYLSEYKDIDVSLVDLSKNFKKIVNCDILIPAMTIIDSTIMQKAKSLKLNTTVGFWT